MAMSASEPRLVSLQGQSASADADQALREALGEIQQALIEAGGAPWHLTEVILKAPEPARFHMARREIDLAWREVFGGFRPRITLRKTSEAGLTVLAQAQIPAATEQFPVWHGLDPIALAKEYSPRGQVASMQTVFDKWRRDGAVFRESQGALGIAYGNSPDETFDLFMPPRIEHPPLWIFIHGGYWQASCKEQHAQFASGMLRAGFAVAMPDYSLCPSAPLDGIGAQLQRFLDFMQRESDALGFDRNAIHLAGHSAGGHLAALAACNRFNPVRSSLLLSGLFELEPLTYLPMARILGLDQPGAAAALSPMRMPRPAGHIGIAAGGKESAEFKWQSAELAARWNAPEPLIMSGANHFDLLDGLNGGALLDFAIALARNA